MEDRILDLERDVTNLRVENAGLGKSVEHLSLSVEKLSEVVQELRDTMNKGRGALWILGSTAAGLGSITTIVAESIFRR